MPDERKPADNISRLLSHLKQGSLASLLVQSYQKSTNTKDLADLIDQRISQTKHDLDAPED